jgi:hypothetical protein
MQVVPLFERSAKDKDYAAVAVMLRCAGVFGFCCRHCKNRSTSLRFLAGHKAHKLNWCAQRVKFPFQSISPCEICVYADSSWVDFRSVTLSMLSNIL